MKRSAQIGAAILIFLALAGSAVYVFRGQIALALFERAAARGVAAAWTDDLPDGLHAAFCGTGSPLPDRGRAGPCLAVLAGERLLVFDAGEGAAETLSLMGLTPSNIDAVFLTHLHSDHFDGLGALALQHWASGAAEAPMVVLGPPGVERVAAGLNEAYAIDAGYRIAHHSADVLPRGGFGIAARAFATPAPDARTIVYEEGGVRVIAFKVAHAPVEDAVGFRVEYGGRALVISGDTKRTPAIARESRGADLLIHEAISPRISAIMRDAARGAGRESVAQIFDDIQDYHTTPEDVAALAQEAGVPTLAFTHIIPPLPIPGLDVAFLGDAKSRFDGEIWMMRDGDIISLPVSGAISRRRAPRF